MIAHNFPTINNIPIYKSKTQTLYSNLRVTDTPYSVDSHGLTAVFYVCPTTPKFESTYAKWQSNIPLIKLYTGKAFPLEISPNYQEGNSFGIHYTGHFVPSGNGTFLLYGTGKARLTISSNDTGTIDLSLINVATLGVTSLSADTAISIKYLSPGKQSNADNGFVVLWESSDYTKPIPLSAGICKSNADYLSAAATTPPAWDFGATDFGGGFIQPDFQSSTATTSSAFSAFSLPDVTSIFLDEGTNKSSKLTFEVPLVRSTATAGYYFDDSSDKYVSIVDSDKFIKPFTKIELQTGYLVDGSLSTITKFTGQIRETSVTRSKGKDMLQVTCYDWSSFLTDSFNEGSPDPVDYCMLNINERYSDINIINSKPKCFDGWYLDDALDCLLINSYIDPVLLYGKQKRISVDDTVVTTDYYQMHEKNNSRQTVLDRKFNLGQSSVTLKDNMYTNISTEVGSNDEAYIWQFPIGQKNLDSISKMLQTYGYRFGFSNDGYFYTKAINAPITVKTVEDFNQVSDTWQNYWHPKNIGLRSLAHASNGATLGVDFDGFVSQLVVERGANAGTIEVSVTNSTLGNVYTASLELNYPREHRFYQGHDDLVGYNPCVFTLGTSSKYGRYHVVVTKRSADTVTVPKINALLVYNDAQFSPVETINTHDDNNDASITDFSYKQSGNMLRNDIVVVGALKGPLSLMSQGNSTSIVNPNNPISTHVLARAVDRAAIGSVSASNYVGRKLQTIIIEPKINTEQQATWLAVETGKKYNTIKKITIPKINLIGNPVLEPGDFVQVVDGSHESLTDSFDFWIDTTTHSYTKESSKTTLDLTAARPWDSYIKYPTPSPSLFPNPIVNIETYNTGVARFKDEYCTVASSQSLIGFGSTVTTLQVRYVGHNLMWSTTTALDTLVKNIIPRIGVLKLHNAVHRILPNSDELVHYSDYDIDVRAETDNTPGVIATVVGTKCYQNAMPYIPAPMSVYGTITFKNLQRGHYNTVAKSVTKLTPVSLEFSPYMTEEEGISPAIKFDLLYDGFIRLAIINEDGVLVDVLSGEDDKVGTTEGWQYLKAGTYEYTWGAIDRVGMHNQTNGGYFTTVPLNSYNIKFDRRARKAIDGDWVDHFGGEPSIEDKAYGITGDQHKVGSGFYVHNMYRQLEGHFVFDLQYKEPVKENFKTVVRPSVPRQIHTALHHSVEEELQVKPYYALFVSDQSGVLLETSVPWLDSRGFDELYALAQYHPNERRIYTGVENSGKGALLSINTESEATERRLCKIKIERKILVITRFKHQDAPDKEIYPRTVSEIFEEPPLLDTDYFITSDDLIQFYVGPPTETPFITEQVHEHSNQSWHLSVAHVHLFKVTITDYSGRKSVGRASRLYVDPLYAVQTNKMYDSITDNMPVRMFDNYPDGSHKYIAVEGMEGEYPPHIRKHSHYLNDKIKFLGFAPERVMGVLLKGV